MIVIEDLNKDCPEHDRDSCSDENPINAGVDYRSGHTWCRRCQGLWTIKAEAALAAHASDAAGGKGVPTAEHWRTAIEEQLGILFPENPGLSKKEFDWIKRRVRELAAPSPQESK